MNEKKLRHRNLAMKILIFIATYVGINTVTSFFNIKLLINTADNYTIFTMSAALALDYMIFLVLALIVFIMNFVTRQSLTKKQLIIRSVVLGIALIMIWYSAPSISYITYMGASRYTDLTMIYPVDLNFVVSYISQNLWTVFSYMFAAVAYIVMTFISIISIMKSHTKK